MRLRHGLYGACRLGYHAMPCHARHAGRSAWCHLHVASASITAMHALQAYYQFLRNMCYLAPVGWVLCMIRPGVKGTSNNATDMQVPPFFERKAEGSPTLP